MRQHIAYESNNTKGDSKKGEGIIDNGPLAAGTMEGVAERDDTSIQQVFATVQ
jgi:hypothetical protein